ncbi:hypothetical protein PR048_020550 [Dryococelus australis]|uniref:K Homology domain-containing protein n=1 Tax=Dryococelus australis TaxID=614101 RepID=A0ABQ9H6M2_9NEOP|nr:hypothetical protein PR048_020550 [Dryococelus australis]
MCYRLTGFLLLLAYLSKWREKMAPKPSYQLLIWSVPTVAFLLTCLWYRRKRKSSRSDPGGTVRADLTALTLKKSDPCVEPATKLSESQSESTRQVKANEKDAFPAAIDIRHTEVGSIEDLCRKTEIDSLVTSVQREDLYTPENHTDLKDKSFFHEEDFESLQTDACVKSEPVVLKCKEELEKNREASEESEEEVECKGKIEEESECSDKSNKEAIYTTENKVTECKETTLDCEIQELEHVASINDVQVLSEVLSDDISDKSVDISNFPEGQESDSATKPSSQTVFIPDSFSSEPLAEEKLCISSSDKCVVTNGAEPSCIKEDCESTALQSSLCESCNISDSALTKQHSEDSGEEATVRSVVNPSELGGEAGCVVSAGRTVMARKSSTDLPMERSADSDGAATHRESKLSVSEQRKNGAENVQVERDSANHSPADVMLGSPAISNYSDANSETTASHLGKQSSILGGFTSGFLHVGIMPDDADVQHHNGNSACLAHRSDEALGVRVLPVSLPRFLTLDAEFPRVGKESHHRIRSSARRHLKILTFADMTQTESKENALRSAARHLGKNITHSALSTPKDSGHFNTRFTCRCGVVAGTAHGSSDSGKGCSDMATPPPRTPASGSSLAGDVPSIYEFVLPQHLVGRLIGRFGTFVHQIKDKTNANIFIKKHPDTTKLKICAIEEEWLKERVPEKFFACTKIDFTAKEIQTRKCIEQRTSAPHFIES